MRTHHRQPTARTGHRRPAALLAFLWLLLSVIAHHDLPETAPATAFAPAAVATHPHAPSGLAVHAPSGHRMTGPAHAGGAGHLHDDGAPCSSGAHCSSYDVRSEHVVGPPPLLGTVRTARAAAPPTPGPRPVGGPSPPDPATLSVLRI
ncbi:DUF6153 family protein [Streptomyces noursei]|uniref:DUF6153 family protein n=1 Tax=Streptomyces noursei TaxID=1971 RepID=UPI0023B80EEE|nr:DUF6153 family protein [Streptomyces noursei]